MATVRQKKRKKEKIVLTSHSFSHKKKTTYFVYKYCFGNYDIICPIIPLFKDNRPGHPEICETPRRFVATVMIPSTQWNRSNQSKECSSSVSIYLYF